MSFLTELVRETRRKLEDIGRSARSRDIEDIAIGLSRDMPTAHIEDIAEPILVTAEAELDRCTAREEEELVERYAIIVSETILLTALEKERLDRELSSRDLENFKDSRRKWETLMDDAKELSRRDRGRDRGRRDRRDDDRDRGRRSSSRSRRDRDTGNTRHNNSFEREGDREERESSSRRSREEDVQVQEVIQGIANGQAVTSENFPMLPAVAKEVPLYFAGLEELVFNEERGKAVAVILEGAFKVNYEKHRTDIWLKPNRDPQNVPLKIEDLEERAKKAANERVQAYIENEAEGEVSDQFVKIDVNKDLIIDGIYRTSLPAVGAEREFRSNMEELLETASLNDHVVGISTIHCINDLENVDRTDEDYVTLIDTLTALAIDTKLGDVKIVLNLAAKLFDLNTYDVIHRLYNEAVCNALSVSLKLGIKTSNILEAWADIEKLVEEATIEQPHISAIIQMNLCAALPTIFESPEVGLGVYRNYIFLPYGRSDLTIASPVRYATLNKSAREQLYGLVNKLLTTNVPAETFKPYTTLVTADNHCISLFKNRALVNDSGYYVFAPINQ